MLTTPTLATWLLIWLVAFGVVIWSQRKAGAGAGLVTAYAVQLMVLHWIAAAMYVVPASYGNMNLSIVFPGLQQSTYAILGFMAGSALFTPFVFRNRQGVTAPVRVQPTADASLIRMYAAIGVVAYAGLLLPAGRVPTLSALIASASNFVVLALGLMCWNGFHRGRAGLLWLAVVLSTLLPFATIVLQGFLGYGFAAMVTVFAFVASFYRPRWRLVVASGLVFYLGLSMYVTYMRDREEIRDVVWAAEDLDSRVDQLRTTFGSPELFDVGNVQHLQRIDTRLNQNYLVGAAVMFLGPRPAQFAGGDTIWQALLAPIPRALWPNKPFEAGSGDLVTRFTGIRFAEGTSVGIGQVMELYVNFGSAGVWLGFIVIGAVLGFVDRRAAQHLHEGQWRSFALWMLPGIGMLQVGGALVEVTASVAAAFVVALVVGRIGTGRRESVSPVAYAPDPSAPEES